MTTMGVTVMEASNNEMEAGGIATPSVSSVAGYTFVPPLTLMTDVDVHPGSSLSMNSPFRPSQAPSVVSYSFVPPFQFIPEADSKPTTAKNMTSSSSPKLLSEKSFYKNISNLPITIKQITYNSDEVETPRKVSLSQMHRKPPKHQTENDPINKDIAKQVDNWMKNKPLPDDFMYSLTAQRANLQSNSMFTSRDRHGKRQKKRHRLKDSDDGMTSGNTTARGSESDITLNAESNRNKRNKIPHSVSKSLIKENENDKRSIFGSVHNEIEFQKRYRRMFDLNKHLQFVNSTNGLMGKKIFKKGHHLPPIVPKKPQELECSEMFAIATVQQSNNPKDAKNPAPKSLWDGLPMSSEYSETNSFQPSTAGYPNCSSRQSFNDELSGKNCISNVKGATKITPRSEVFKFGKLPRISHDGNEIPNNYNSKTDSFDKTRSIFTSETKSFSSKFDGSFQRSGSNLSNGDSGNEDYEVREMKVTINIKYKQEDKRKDHKDPAWHTEKHSDEEYVNLTPFDKLHRKPQSPQDSNQALFSE